MMTPLAVIGLALLAASIALFAFGFVALRGDEHNDDERRRIR